MDIKQLFLDWPDAIPKKGAVVTGFGEAIPFSEFMLNGDLILFRRSTPDAAGTQIVVVKCSDLVAVKFQEAIDPMRFTAMGFQRPDDAVA